MDNRRRTDPLTALQRLRDNAHPSIPRHLIHCGVLVRTLRKGDGKTFPNPGDECVIHCQAFLMDGTLLDTSRSLRVTVGARQVVVGLDVVLPTLSVGQLVRATIPALYAYGAQGCPPSVPPHTALEYELELVQVVRHS